jgi:Zn/Cd-binding protein ZinT
MEFNIYGKITFEVDFDIKAENEQEAIKKSLEKLKDYYRLNVKGTDHNIDTVEIDIDAVEYEDL